MDSEFQRSHIGSGPASDPQRGLGESTSIFWGFPCWTHDRLDQLLYKVLIMGLLCVWNVTWESSLQASPCSFPSFHSFWAGVGCWLLSWKCWKSRRVDTLFPHLLPWDRWALWPFWGFRMLGPLLIKLICWVKKLLPFHHPNFLLNVNHFASTRQDPSSWGSWCSYF